MIAVESLFSFFYVSAVRSDEMDAETCLKNPDSLKVWRHVAWRSHLIEKRGAQAFVTIWDASIKET